MPLHPCAFFASVLQCAMHLVVACDETQHLVWAFDLHEQCTESTWQAIWIPGSVVAVIWPMCYRDSRRGGRVQPGPGLSLSKHCRGVGTTSGCTGLAPKFGSD